MGPSGKSDLVTTFKVVKLQKQQNGHSWSIVGYLSSDDFRILGVLEKPIPYSLLVSFVQQLAQEFGAVPQT